MFIDAKKLKNSLKPEDIIRIVMFLGADTYEEKSSCLIFPTICHNTTEAEKSMKLYYFFDSRYFRCFTECDSFFDIYDLVGKVFALRGIKYSEKECFQTVANILNIDIFDFNYNNTGYESQLLKYKNKNSNLVLPQYDSNVLASFAEFYPPEWIDEGITEETMRKFGIRYNIPKNKIVIPHYDVNDRMIGIRGRAMNEYEIERGNKYMPLEAQGIMYSHPLSYNLYGLNVNYKYIRETGTAVIFEGEKSVLKLDSIGCKNNSVAVCGSNLNRIQVELLLKYCNPKEIVIAFDKEYDKNYTKESEKYYLKLKKIADKYRNYCNFSFIFDMENLLDKKDSPIDKGYKIYERLFNNRIK